MKILREKDPERYRRLQKVIKSIRIIFRSSLAHSALVKKKIGLSSSQLWMLSEILEKPGIKVSELADIIEIHQSTCSNIIDNMQKKHLIRKDRNGQDQRVVHLYLTEEGTRLVTKAPRPVQGIIADALQRLSEIELSHVEDCMEILLKYIQKTDKDAGMIPLDHE